HDYYQYPPLDKKMDDINLPNMLMPINKLEPIEISNRIINYTKLVDEKNIKLKKENKNLSQKLEKQKKEIKNDKEKINNCNKQLQRKSVKIGKKLGDTLIITKKKLKNIRK